MADQGTPRDAQGEIIVTLYDPVTIEAIVLDWDGASPSEYTIEISNHGEVWTEVAHLKDLESPGAGKSFQRRLGVRYDKPVTLIRVKTLGNATVWGLNINDFKAYGTYANVDPAYLILSPYVNVAYTTTTVVDDVEETKTVVNDHPNTVAFYTAGSGDQFGQEMFISIRNIRLQTKPISISRQVIQSLILFRALTERLITPKIILWMPTTTQ